VHVSESEPSIVDLAVSRRAVEAVMWGMPAVNYQMMYEASARAGGPGDNQIVFWPGLLDWRNQTLTPNPDVIYVMPFFTTKDVGPMVLEVPPADDGALNGSIMNYWQVAIEDIGPAGVDGGKGGRLLILPPDHDGMVQDGYIPLRSDTYQGYGLIRSVLRSGSDADVAQAIDYAKRIKLYPLAQADAPQDTAWVDASRRVRRNDPLRLAVLPGTGPDRAGRAVPAPRPDHDQPAAHNRHRAGNAVQPGPGHRTHPDFGHRRCPRLDRCRIPKGVPALQPGQPVGAAGAP
jgi:hypothetical protein